jgi:hypothetical protein
MVNRKVTYKIKNMPTKLVINLKDKLTSEA